jgi:hypothetical protein
MVVFVGPQTKIYKFFIRTREWSLIKGHPQSAYKGNIKHQSIVALQHKRMLLLTGGVSVATCSPLSFCYTFSLNDISKASGT